MIQHPAHKAICFQRGSTMPMTMIFLGVFTIITIATLKTATNVATLSINQTHSYQAAQLAKAAIHRISQEFHRGDINLLGTLLCQKEPTNVRDPECDADQTLCFSANELFPKDTTNKTIKTSHGGMKMDGLTTHSDLSKAPSLWGNFLVRVENPVLATTNNPNPGNAIGQGCLYRITVTTTGSVINPNVTSGHLRELSTRSYRAFINVAADQTLCGGCPIQ